MEPGDGDQDFRRSNAKSAAAFRTISEVGREIDVPQHVLRFWESKFSQIKPLKRGGGRRYYRPEDVALLRRIRELLYSDGYTIKGVQKLLRDSGVKAVLEGADQQVPDAIPAADDQEAADALGEDGQFVAVSRLELNEIMSELMALRQLLDAR
jgi:DNA-binding transcriptional MerR regulator